MKAFAKLILRIVALTGLYFVVFSTVSVILIPTTQPPAADNELNVVTALLIVSLLNTIVLSYVILRSRAAGRRLFASLFIVFFGVSTFMSQIETAIFVTWLPAGLLTRIVLSGLLVSLIFSCLAVLVLGKWRTREKFESRQLNLTKSEWALRLSVLAALYVIVYFTFGYFLAWRNPAVRAFYHGSDLTDFFTQIKSVFTDTPWLPPFQFVRGVFWTLLALPVIRMMKGHWWESGIAVGLCFGVLMSSLLLIPNPLMPKEVRLAHLWETASSNFLFGWMVVIVLVRWRTAKGVHNRSHNSTDRA